MRPGVENASAELFIDVTKAMTARLDEQEIHRLYSTFWLGRHVELAARRVIEPFFEPGEDALGSALNIEHLAMTPVGARIRIYAWVTEVKGNMIRCDFSVQHGKLLVARGTQDQVCLPAAKIGSLIQQAYARLE